ncbi:MAG: zinc ribbon domain-containing protein [Clostridia bacterium]|nr:zinc ribbon domain-containing protein [Clostridia bacterium]
MAFFNDFKELFASAAQSVSNKTKDGVEIGRIASESRSIANELADIYEQIGRLYVDSKGGNIQEIAPLCEKALELRERLETLERQKLQIRNQNRCPACGAVAAKDAKFCSACGRRMPEPAPETESAPAVENVCYCPECGAMKKDGDRFCDVCGHNYDGTPAPAAPVKPAPAPVQDDSDEAPDDFEAD